MENPISTAELVELVDEALVQVAGGSYRVRGSRGGFDDDGGSQSEG